MPYAKISFLFFLFIGICAAQESKVKKANDAYETYSFINAQKIYLKVVEDGYESPQVFKKLGDTSILIANTKRLSSGTTNF